MFAALCNAVCGQVVRYVQGPVRATVVAARETVLRPGRSRRPSSSLTTTTTAVMVAVPAAEPDITRWGQLFRGPKRNGHQPRSWGPHPADCRPQRPGPANSALTLPTMDRERQPDLGDQLGVGDGARVLAEKPFDEHCLLGAESGAQRFDE